MARNAFSALSMSDDDEDEVQLSNKIGSKQGKKGPSGSRSANANPVSGKSRQGAKSEKSVNKNRGGKSAGTTKKREKDRHVSGTGRGRGVKKGGAGAHNWGTGTENLDGEGGDGAGEEDENAENQEDSAPPGISYDEWQAQQSKNTNSEAFKVLEKPKTKSDFKGAKLLKKTDGEAVLLPEGQKKAKKKKNQAKKQFIDANITVKNSDSGDRPPRRDRGDRRNGGGRGRGGNKGRGNRGGGRSSRGQGIKLNNANEFPALG